MKGLLAPELRDPQLEFRELDGQQDLRFDDEVGAKRLPDLSLGLGEAPGHVGGYLALEVEGVAATKMVRRQRAARTCSGEQWVRGRMVRVGSWRWHGALRERVITDPSAQRFHAHLELLPRLHRSSNCDTKLLHRRAFGVAPVLRKTGSRKSENPLQIIDLKRFFLVVGGVDGTRTRDPRRDRPVF